MIEVNTTNDTILRQAFAMGTRCHATRAFIRMLWLRKTKYITLYEFEKWANDCAYVNKEALSLLDALFTDYFWEGTELERRTEMNKILKAIRIDLPVKAIGRITKLRMFLMFH